MVFIIAEPMVRLKSIGPIFSSISDSGPLAVSRISFPFSEADRLWANFWALTDLSANILKSWPTVVAEENSGMKYLIGRTTAISPAAPEAEASLEPGGAGTKI